MPTTASAPLVHCVLVNWNGFADTSACLRSLMAQDYPALHVVVVDNGSTDGSAAGIRADFPHVTVIETGRNLGFPSGCNVGLRHVAAIGADLAWLLNNDTIAPPDTCSKLVAAALANPTAGIIGSVLYYLPDPTQVQAWGGGRMNLWLARTTHELAPFPLGRTTYFTFASALIPTPILHKVGILYEGFFMYWDDADFALRVTAAGYSLAMAESTAILHKEGGSSERRSPIIDRYAIAAGLHFIRRHAPAPPLTMALFLATKIMSRGLRGDWKNVRAVLAAAADYRQQRHRTYRDTLSTEKL